MRLYEIAGTCLIVLMLLIGCYLGGFWLWATPARDYPVQLHPVSPRGPDLPLYDFADTSTNRALVKFYAPIFFMQSASIVFSPKIIVHSTYNRIQSPANTPELENPFALFDEFIEP